MSERTRPSVPIDDQLNPEREGGQRTFRERLCDEYRTLAAVLAVGACALTLTGCGETARAEEKPRAVTVAPAVVPVTTPEYTATPEPRFIYTGKPYSEFPAEDFNLKVNTSYTQEEIAERLVITLEDARQYKISPELLPRGSDQTTKDTVAALALFMEKLRILTATTDKTYGELIDAATAEALTTDPSALEELRRLAETLRTHGNGFSFTFRDLVTAHSMPGKPAVEVFVYMDQKLETDQTAYTPDVVEMLTPFDETVLQIVGGFNEAGEFKVSRITIHPTDGHTFNGIPLNTTED